ncbi:MAG: Replication factor C small subunit [Candidatus Heimdallarchaeota archaeon LC_3]|nr:MAG: Replication factor C small subunit [Candidatus Heimdallarchaeota archaeon LC_3]
MWIEDYRPKKLADVLGQEVIIERLMAFAKDKGNMPHFLFAGPAGVGKTSTAIALAREIFQESFAENYKELNASDERGIKMVREDIKKYASIMPAARMPFRLLVLDEADNMTSDAQQALRRTMEKYKSLRFILIANYSSKIISPIQSRCAVFRFRPIPKNLVKKKIAEITKNEGINIEEKAIDALCNVSEGDMRKLLNVMQAASVLSSEITEEVVHDVAGRAHPKKIDEMLNILFTHSMDGFFEARKKLRSLLYSVGVSGKDLVKQIHTAIIDNTNIAETEKVTIIGILGEVDFRLTEGANEEIQLVYLLAKIIDVMNKNT